MREVNNMVAKFSGLGEELPSGGITNLLKSAVLNQERYYGFYH